jgi:hypothetical protein
MIEFIDYGPIIAILWRGFNTIYKNKNGFKTLFVMAEQKLYCSIFQIECIGS